MTTDKNTTIKELRKIFLNFSKERGWEKGYYPNQLAQSVAIEAAELLEQFQWKDNIQSCKSIKLHSHKKNISFEIVDILYYLLMLAEIMNIDVLHYVHLKLKELESRYPKIKQKQL